MMPMPMNDMGLAPGPELEGLLQEQALGDIQTDEVDHSENLADQLPDDFKRRLADRIIEAVRRDKESRSEWDEQLSKGYELMGLDRAQDERTDPFPGASSANHPMLAEASADFAARAMKELAPADGPVRTRIVGRETPPKQIKANRVQEHMNYQLTVEMVEWAEELDTLLMQLPVCGSCFKKLYWDVTLNRPVSEYVKAEDFVVPYGAKSLASAPRYTHILHVAPGDVRRNQVYGFWLDVPLGPPQRDDEGESRVREINDQIQGEQPSEDPDDQTYTIYECHIDVDDPELTGLEQGAPEGLPLPYVVTVHRDTATVLAVRRNWRIQDERYAKRLWFVHYKFMPWRGFYGIGLFHLIGGLSRAATGALRAMLDQAMIRAVPGGLRKKVGRNTGQTVQIAACQWNEVETTPGERLADAFMAFPIPPSDPIMFQLLDYVGKAGKQFANVATQTVADMNPNAPVGTTLALIEQTSIVYSAIHARLHRAESQELKLLADLNRENLNDQVTVRKFGGELIVNRWDYDEEVDIIPVSDPNVFSQVQRAQQAQATLKLAQEAKQGGVPVDLRAAYIQTGETLKLPNLEAIFPAPPQPQPMDPVSELRAISQGMPVKAFPGQDHQAHVMFLTAKAQDPAMQPLMQMVGPALQALVADHLVWQAAEEAMTAVQAMTGGQPVPPEVASQIMAQAAMQTAQQRVMQAQQAAAQQGPQGDPAAMAEVARRAKRDEGELALKARDQDIKATQAEQKLALDAQKDVAEGVERAAVDRERMATDVALEEMRVASEEKREAAKLAVKVQLEREEQASDERMAAQASEIKASVST